jgi:hypothetical protein
MRAIVAADDAQNCTVYVAKIYDYEHSEPALACASELARLVGIGADRLNARRARRE